MLALKLTRPGAVGSFSFFAWPRPTAEGPGAWVEAAPGLSGTVCGIHACDADDLAYWLDAEMWIIELAGTITTARHQRVATRARLVARVEGWDAACERALATAAALRARGHAVDALRGAGERDLADALEAASDAATTLAVAQASATLPRPLALAVAYVADTFGDLAADPRASLLGAAHAAVTPEGFARERAWQSRWVAERLALAQVLAR